MTVDSIRVVLGRLQDDPGREQAWQELAEIVAAPASATDVEVHRLLEQARSRHEQRREWSSVARMLEMEVALVAGQPEELAMQAELARIADEELFDAARARSLYERLGALAAERGASHPLAEKASSWLEDDAAKREKWESLYDRYLAESESTDDASFQAGLLVGAADVAFRYAGEKVDATVIADLVERAVLLDPRARRAIALAERSLAADPTRLAKLLSAVLERGASKDDRVAAGIKAARLHAQLGEAERATEAYEKVLDLAPGQPDALSQLAEAYTRAEAWDHLVALYEDQLKGGGRPEGELGLLLQIAMVHWRMREKPEAAEPYFERVRRAEPTHAGMLAFYRERCTAQEDKPKLLAVLTEAQRATSDGELKRELAAEIAQLAEAQDNAVKAIEQYKTILKADPDDVSARDALKRLYAQTNNHPALIDLYRHELERLGADDVPARAAVLRELATIHRDRHRNEQALIQTLAQLVQLDDKDEPSLRELVQLYESLGRFRDLLGAQQRLAELSSDPSERAELYRAVARRWTDQFSNVQNAIAAYEGLLAVDKSDAEARTKLRDLYTKRRAWDRLHALAALELESAEGEARIELLAEMAKLAAERLDRGAEAISLYKQILELDPRNFGVHDALEKQAEREKDYASVAEALEKRAEVTDDGAARLAIYQKLGSVYADRLRDDAGATRTWKRVLELSPGQAKALRVLRETYVAAGDLDALEELYASQGDWDALADFLSSSADKATEPDAKIALSFRAAKVYVERLEAPERATRSYERVLAADPGNAEAASALLPIYEQEARWARLPALYEILLTVTEDAAERARMLRKLADVVGHSLGDRAGALNHARRAYELAPDAEGLELLESWARAAGDFAPFVEAVSARLGAGGAAAQAPAPKKGKKKKKGEPAPAEVEVEAPASLRGGAPALDPSEERLLRIKLADAYARELGKLDEAVEEYKKLLVADPADTETAQALDTLLRGAERQADLRWLFELRIANAAEGDRAGIYEEWATLEEDVFGNTAEAVRLYREAVSLDPSRTETLRALARLLLAAGDHAGAAGVIERHRDLVHGDERAQREIELATLYAERLERPLDALEACERALDARPRDADAIGLLGKLVELEPTRGRAAARLALSYADLGDHRREAQMLRVLIETTEEPDRRLELHVALADAEEKKLGSPSAAFDVVLRALNEFPDELALWDRAAELAVASGRPTDLAEAYRAHILVSREGDDGERHGPSEGVELELCDRAASLHDEQLGDSDGALPYLKRILAKDPHNATAFARLKEILSAAERWGELESLFDQAAASADDPRTKIELLSEVALVAEEVMGLPEKAIRYHERILEIDPLHEASLDALEKLYEDAERFGELAALLERRLETALDDEAVDIRLYLARLYLDQLLVPERALGHVEEILKNRSDDADARELAERMLEIGSLKRRVALLLEGVYEARDEVKNLVRMLEIHLEYVEESDVEQRAAILRRIAELRDERLSDDEGAFEALGLLVPLLPEDEGLRERYSEVGRRLDKHRDVVDVLTRAAEAAQPKLVRAEILMSVATLAEDALGDSAKAAEIYRKVLEIDPDDTAIGAPATRALARIQSASGDFAQLAETLEAQAKLEDSIDARKELYARLGELYETTLDRPEKAITAWQARLADDDGDLPSLSALERLYERAGKHRELVDVLRRREAAEDDADARRRVMVKAAQTLAEKLEEPQEAISAWRAVTDGFGADREAHAALRRLYEKTERYQDLADVIEADLALADDPTERRKLLVASGDVRRKHLGELDAALEAYRSALELDPNDADARAALEAMLDLDEAKRGASEILRPLYEADGAFEALLRVLGLEAELEEVPAERITILEKARETAEGPLGNPQKAYDYAQRLVRDAVADDSLERQVETLERLSKDTGRWAETCALYRSIVDEVADGELQLAMLLRIGALAREELRDLSMAIEFYQKALESSPDELRALTALESIYAEKGDTEALLGVLSRRAELADSDADRVELLFRSAELQREKLGDTAAAVSTLESLLDYQVDERATSKLEVLYREAERHRDLVALYERMLEASGADPAELRVKIARLARGPLEDMPRAFDELSEALALEASHPGAVAELESVLDDEASTSEDRARAAEMLEPVYLKQAAWKKVERATKARLDASQDPDERAELLRRLATLYEEQLEDYAAALETTAKLLSEEVRDEAVWAELERLARVGSSHARLAEIFATELAKVDHDDEATARLSARTGELYAAEGKATEALRWYRRAHAFEPESEALFEAIDGLLVKEERHAERVDLLKAALDYRDGAPRLELLHTIAELEETKLDRADDAIESYRAALDVDPRDELALDRLGKLYDRLERHRDLAELHERRADQADLSEQAAPFRLALARLLISKLDDTPGAIDQLEAIVGADPRHKGAIAELEKLTELEEHRARIIEILRPLYEDADAWQKVVELNEQRLAGEEDPRERAVILRETAVLWETRGGDAKKAFEAVRAAFEADPGDPATREELERLAASAGSFEQVSESIARTAEGVEEAFTKRELLQMLARIEDQRLDHPRRALAALERVVAIDPSDLEPLEAIDELAVLLGEWTKVVDIAHQRAASASDAEAAELLRRAARTRAEMLDDREGAVEDYEKSLSIEPDSRESLERLSALLEEAMEGSVDEERVDEERADVARRERAQRLVELYTQRVELGDSSDADLRFELHSRAAKLHEAVLESPRDAISSLDAALEARPSDGDTLASLERLYRRESMWHELLENLRQQAALAADTAARAELRTRIGDLLRVELSSPAEALEQYKLVLDEAPEHTGAITALRAIADSEEDLRVEATEVLLPFLRAGDKHEDRVAVLELRAGSLTEPGDRAEVLGELASVLDEKLDRPTDALKAMLRALDELPEREDLHGSAERLARRVGASAAEGDEQKRAGYALYADALFARAERVLDPEVAKSLWARLGRLAELELDDPKRAAEAYSKALEHAGDDVDLLSSLDRLYERLGEHRALVEVLERRIPLGSAEEQADLLHRIAKTQIVAFKDVPQGLSSLRSALERFPGHAGARATLEELTADPAYFTEVSEILEDVYRSSSDHAALARLFEKRIAHNGSAAERVRLRLELSKVLEEKASEPSAALDALIVALDDDVADSDVLAEIERVSAIVGGWERSARGLEKALEKQSDLGSETASDLWIRVATWRRDKLGDVTGAEAGYEQALRQDPQNEVILRSIEQLQRSAGRERDLVATLRRLAALDGSPSTVELRREAKAIAESQLGDPALAEEILREMVAADEADAWALTELCALRRAASDWKEVYRLLVRRTELAADGESIRELRHEAAEVARRELSDLQAATDLHEQNFEAQPTDERASSALRELYAEAGKKKELLALLTRLVDVNDDKAKRSALRLEAAKVANELEGTSEAIELLDAVLEEEPAQAEAALELSRLLEKAGRDDDLASLLTKQISLARERGDVGAELGYLVRLGEVQESRLGALDKAVESFVAVLDRDAAHRPALEALARLHERRGQKAEATPYLERLLDGSTGAEALATAKRLATLFGELSDEAGERRILERALAIEESDAEVRTRLRALYERQGAHAELASIVVGDARAAAEVGEKLRLLKQAADIHATKLADHGKAADLLKEASDLAPTDRELLLSLCDAYSASGRGKQAVEVLQQIVESYGGRRSKEVATIHHRLAKAYLADQDREKALAELDTAFKIDPGAIGVLRDLGVLSLELADGDPAQQAAYVDRAGKTFKALLLQRLDDASPITKSEVFYYLGEVAHRQGDDKRAIQMLERAIDNDKGFERAKTLLEKLKGGG